MSGNIESTNGCMKRYNYFILEYILGCFAFNNNTAIAREGYERISSQHIFTSSSIVFVASSL